MRTKQGRVNHILRAASLAVVASMLLVVAACGHQAPPPPDASPEPPKPAMLEHTVQYRGETLGLIARWYTGRSSNWQEIVAANPGLRPERINIGDTIMIPAEIVVNEQPMPASAVKRSASAKAEDAEQGNSKAAATSDADVVGDSQAAPSEAPTSAEEDLSVDDLLGAIAAERAEKEGVIDAAPVADAPEANDSVPEVVKEDAVPAPDAVEQKADEVEPTGSGGGAADEDAERERLLDELLAQ